MNESWDLFKEYTTITIQTVKEGSVSAISDSKVAAVVSGGTIVAGLELSSIGVAVGIVLSVVLIVKHSLDTFYKIQNHRIDKQQKILDREIKLSKERDRQRSIAEAEKLGQTPKRQSDLE